MTAMTAMTAMTESPAAGFAAFVGAKHAVLERHDTRPLEVRTTRAERPKFDSPGTKRRNSDHRRSASSNPRGRVFVSGRDRHVARNGPGYVARNVAASNPMTRATAVVTGLRTNRADPARRDR